MENLLKKLGNLKKKKGVRCRLSKCKTPTGSVFPGFISKKKKHGDAIRAVVVAFGTVLLLIRLHDPFTRLTLRVLITGESSPGLALLLVVRLGCMGRLRSKKFSNFKEEKILLV